MWFGPQHSPTRCVHVFLVEIQGNADSHSNCGTSVSGEWWMCPHQPDYNAVFLWMQCRKISCCGVGGSHSLYLCLHSATTMFSLAPSLTRPLILLYLHSPACLPSPSHQITHFVTARMTDLALSFTHYSARDCTHHDHACRRPLTHSLYLWLHSLSFMLALLLTHSTCDYFHLLVFTIKNEKRGDRERVCCEGIFQ